MTRGLVVTFAAVQLLTLAVVVNSASLQSADVIAATQRRRRPCVNSGSGEPCTVHISRQSASTTPTSGSLTSDGLDDDRPKRRRTRAKSRPPQRKVTVEDDSVAAALAMAANVGRGPSPPFPPPPPPPPPVGPKPPAAKPLLPGAAAAMKPASGGGGGGGGGGNSVNVMLTLGCEAEPCQNGGVCYTDAFSSRGFSCRCADGYYGDVCEYGLYTACVLVHGSPSYV